MSGIERAINLARLSFSLPPLHRTGWIWWVVARGDFQLFSRGLVNLERWVAGGELIDDYDNEEDGDVDMSDNQTLFCTPVLTQIENLPLPAEAE